MSENLSEHVDALRRELGKLTGAFVSDNNAVMDSLMTKLSGMKEEIDALDAFVIKRGDARCQSALRKKMSQYLNRDETKTLILDMGISDFEYTGVSMTGFHTEFIGFCERRELLPLLMSTLIEVRPRVQWPDC